MRTGGSTAGVRREQATVAIHVADPVLEMALKTIVNESSMSLVDNRTAAMFQIADDVLGLRNGTGRGRGIVVVESRPFPAALALGGLRKGSVAAVVSRENIGLLAFVFDVLQRGLIAVASKVSDAASRLPDFTQRQHLVVSMLSGKHMTDKAMSRWLGVSVATVKRDVEAVCEAVDAANRRQLADIARDLGYRPGLTDHEVSLLSHR